MDVRVDLRNNEIELVDKVRILGSLKKLHQLLLKGNKCLMAPMFRPVCHSVIPALAFLDDEKVPSKPSPRYR
jgi:hypothetical protein